MTSGFLISQSIRPWMDTDISWCDCKFDANHYQDSLYAAYGVSKPPSLQNAVVKRKAEYLAGRLCAFSALDQLKLKPQDISSGKMRNPIWPAHVLGSISHSNDRAVAVVTTSSTLSGVGIDIEKKIDTERAHSLKDKIINAQEIGRFTTEPEEFGFWFTIAFSAKESFFKAAFPTVQSYFDFDAVEISHIDPATQGLQLTVINSPHPSLPNGCNFYAHYATLPDDMLATFLTLPTLI